MSSQSERVDRLIVEHERLREPEATSAKDGSQTGKRITEIRQELVELHRGKGDDSPL